MEVIYKELTFFLYIPEFRKYNQSSDLLLLTMDLKVELIGQFLTLEIKNDSTLIGWGEI